MLIIDKKRLPLKESGLPQMVIDQAPKLMRRSKLPIVKAKVGPKISVLIADEKVFDQIPVKKEVKAEVSGLYIVGVKGIRGSLETPAPKKKAFQDYSTNKDTCKMPERIISQAFLFRFSSINTYYNIRFSESLDCA